MDRLSGRWLAALLLLLLSAGTAAAEPGRLQRLPSVAPAGATVSGLSSGAFFAHQMHIAHSGLISGAGLVAGGPYACAEPPDEPWWIALHPSGRTITAVAVCTRVGRSMVETWAGWWGPLPAAPDVERSVLAIDSARAESAIDDPANLADDRVWLFSGSLDTVVPATTVAVLAELYRRLGVTGDRLVLRADVPAAHGLPVEAFEGATRFPKRGCGEHAPPFVIDCDLDAAGQILRHLHPEGFRDRPVEPQRERLRAFDQREFFDAGDPSLSLAGVGYLYVPAACGDGAAACRLHVAFHGCGQGSEAVDDDFVWDGGYNRWAEANAIVVLYPQAVPWSPAWDPFGLGGNPQGCWDWWGYGGDGYGDRRGAQMRAVRAMIGRVLGE